MKTMVTTVFVTLMHFFWANAFAVEMDFDGDGKSDLLFRDNTNNTWNIHLMDGASIIQTTEDVSGMSAVSSWIFNGAGDFNGDGTTDVIIRNSSSGSWYIYNLSGGSIISRGYVDIGNAETVGVQAVADFNNDGYADVLLRDEITGHWTMTLLKNRIILDTISPPMSTVLTWEIVAAKDFDGNGSDDILIRNTKSGTWYIYLYEDTDITSRGYISTLSTDLKDQIKAVADFDGDGNSDLLMRNSDTQVWSTVFMNGRTPRETSNLSLTDSASWSLNSVADYDGDGKADIALRNRGNGQLQMNFMDGITVGSQDLVELVLSPTLESQTLLADDTTNTTSNTTPIANAGSDMSVVVGTSITLDGSNSSDTDGDALSYSWTIHSTPPSSTATLQNPSSSMPVLTPDIAGNYSIYLTVSDGTENSVSDEVVITATAVEATNTAPVANAGIDQTVTTGSTVTLDGSASSDSDNDTLVYTWSLDEIPSGSTATLANRTSVSPDFVADTSGNYVASLVVNDGTTDSATDTVMITASNTNVDITNIELTNTNGSCASYVGTYFSNVTDVRRNADFTGDVQITANSSKCTFAVNEIPNHDFQDGNANFATNVSEQNGNYQVPLSPVAASSVTTLNIGTTNAVMLNGVVVDLLAAACYDVGNEPLGQEKIGCGPDQINNPWRYDPMSPLNTFGTDSHNAHSQPDGTYHYHGDPLALYSQDCEALAIKSPVIGFAADGFPIYGPCIDDNGTIRKAESSYTLKNNGGQRQAVSPYTTPTAGTGNIASSNYDGQFRGDWEFTQGAGDLDQCNGMTVNGQYGYYLTNSFPWVLGCFTGTTDSSFSSMGKALQNKMHSHGENSRSHSH